MRKVTIEIKEEGDSVAILVKPRGKNSTKLERQIARDLRGSIRAWLGKVGSMSSVATYAECEKENAPAAFDAAKAMHNRKVQQVCEHQWKNDSVLGGEFCVKCKLNRRAP